MFRLFSKTKHKPTTTYFKEQAKDQSSTNSDKQIPIHKQTDKNEAFIKNQFGDSPDIIYHHFEIPVQDRSLPALLITMSGIVSEPAINQFVLMPLQQRKMNDAFGKKLTLEQLRNHIYIKATYEISDLRKAAQLLASGASLLFIESFGRALVIHVEDPERRAIMEPTSESVVRGPHEGFTETVEINMALLRRRIHHPSLRFEELIVGEVSKTKVVIAYIHGIAHPDIVERAKNRIQQIEVDSLSLSGELEQYIEDQTFTLFPTIRNTERPDKAAMNLLEGRLLIFVDNDPVALIAPSSFISMFQSTEDFSSRPFYASFVRLLRIFAFFFSITLPSIFIVALNFHKEMIPSELVMSIAGAREKVPFPLTLEIFIMIILFEIVREAGIRMPRPIGQAVSIVGGLILGEVSVAAGLVGAPTIIVVAFSAIATFAITPLTDVIAISRLLLIIPSSLFGAYGLLFAILAGVTHMISIKSLGEPFMSPFAPLHRKDLSDTFLRLPNRFNRKRPIGLPVLNRKRIEKVPSDD